MKRVIDVFLSLIGLCVLSPLFLILAISIKFTSKGPVFFKQKRFGIYKTKFNILKFRTMKTDTPKDTPTHLLKNPDKWITTVGKFLRKTSLDELPQIVNILIGEMSVVGPRPALWNQTDLVTERDKYGSNNILPGLTGLAQVSGRDELSIKEKASIDGEYTQNISFSLDIKCCLLTILNILKSEGVVEGESKNSSKTKN